jgi:hypothetical protein
VRDGSCRLGVGQLDAELPDEGGEESVLEREEIGRDAGKFLGPDLTVRRDVLQVRGDANSVRAALD